LLVSAAGAADALFCRYALKAAYLHLKTITHGKEQALAQRHAGVTGPGHQVGLVETEPEIATSPNRPMLIVAAQVGNHQDAVLFEPPGRGRQSTGWRGQVMQHHVEYHGIHLGEA